MKVGQYVVRRDAVLLTMVGRIVAVRKHAHGHCDSAGSRYIVKVYWLASGSRATHSGAQLKVLCPSCAGQAADFGDDQLERARLECEVCRQKIATARRAR